MAAWGIWRGRAQGAAASDSRLEGGHQDDAGFLPGHACPWARRFADRGVGRRARQIRAIEECFPRSARQRCLPHRMRNMAVKVPADLWPEFKARVTAYYQTPSRAIARDLARGIRADYATALPSAMACFEDDLEACIAHLRLPVTHRRATRTTDALDKPFSSRRGGGVMALVARRAMVRARGRPRGQERGRGCDPRRAAITVAPRLWRPGTRAASELGALPSAARSRR